MTKLIKRVKDSSHKEREEKSGLTTLLDRRLRGDLTETFKIIDGISNYGRYFSIFILKLVTDFKN